MNEHGSPRDTDRRALRRRRRAKRAFVANYIRELSARRNGNATAPSREVESSGPVEQPQGG